MLVKLPQNTKIVSVGETQLKGASNFQVREVVLTWEEQGPNQTFVQYYKGELTGDRATEGDALSEGDYVEATIKVGGKIWEGSDPNSYFNSKEIFKITITHPTEDTPKEDLPF